MGVEGSDGAPAWWADTRHTCWVILIKVEFPHQTSGFPPRLGHAPAFLGEPCYEMALGERPFLCQSRRPSALETAARIAHGRRYAFSGRIGKINMGQMVFRPTKRSWEAGVFGDKLPSGANASGTVTPLEQWAEWHRGRLASDDPDVGLVCRVRRLEDMAGSEGSG